MSFTPNVTIATETGDRTVRDLQIGVSIGTRDSGPQPVRAIAQGQLDRKAQQADRVLWPVLIEQDALGDGLPSRDMVVSAAQRLLVPDNCPGFSVNLHGLCAAARLVGQPGIGYARVQSVHYAHLVFDAAALIRANGVWCESFHPDAALPSPDDADQRQELKLLYPEL